MVSVVAGGVAVLVGYLNNTTQIGQKCTELLHMLCLSPDLPACTKQKHVLLLSQSLDNSVSGLLCPVQELIERFRGTGFVAVCLLDTLSLHCTHVA